MRKTILTTLGSVLVLAAAVQVAAATPHQRAHRANRAPVVTEQFRDSNAYAPLDERSFAPRYYGGGYSAPAGR